MGNKAISNTGPIIHLTEINCLKALKIFQKIAIPSEVKNELRNNKMPIPKNVKIIKLKEKYRHLTEIFLNKYDLDLGESQAIALALQEKSDYFITDNLDARNTSKEYRIETHGSVGIILKAFRKKIIDKQTAIHKVHELYNESSLFITKELIEQIVKEIKKFKT